MSNQLPPESIIIYLDIMGKILSKKDLQKSLQKFAEEKLKKNSRTTFSLFYFREGNAPFLSDSNEDIAVLMDVLKNDWKHRDTEESNFENGLFFCVSQVAAMAMQKQGNYRIIVISDLPSKKSSELVQALMDLVETVKNFPTFIDIVRVGEENLYPDDVKLRIISTLTSGALLYCENEKTFRSTLEGLAKNKALPGLYQGGQVIEDDKKLYYENMALDLVPVEDVEQGQVVCSLCNNIVCNFCNDPADIARACPQCGKVYHECCAALYSWRHNIGLSHIFRCTGCEALLKLDEELVKSINADSVENDPLTEEELNEQTSHEETWKPEASPSLNDASDSEMDKTIKPLAEMSAKEKFRARLKNKENASSSKPPPIAPAKTAESIPKTNPKASSGMSYGLFGPIHKPAPKKEEVSEEPASDTPITTKPKVNTSFTRGVLAKRKRAHKSTMVCPVCSAYIRPSDQFCPKCGTPTSRL